MAKCGWCDKEMGADETETCTVTEFDDFSDGVTRKRDSSYFDDNERCHDCNIVNKEGNYHHPGCDMERCPKCGGQALSCGCTQEDEE